MNPRITAFATLLHNPVYALLFIVLIVWSLVWKGIALWKSAGARQKYWFIAIFILNTAGILEILYIFFFNKPRHGQVQAPKN